MFLCVLIWLHADTWQQPGKNEVRATYLSLCVFCTDVPKGKSSSFDAHAMKTREQTLDPRWSLKAVTVQTVKRRWWVCARCTYCAQTGRLCSLTKMPSHTFSGLSLMHIYFLPFYFTCHSQFITQLCARTYTCTQNGQQRLLMSRNAHRSVKQHDSCRSRGGPLIGWLLFAASGGLQSDNGMPGFSRHGCVNTVQWETGGEKKQRTERSRGELWGRRGGW